METILEQQRRYHEERERLVKAMVDELLAVKQNSVSVLTTSLECFHFLIPLFLFVL